jgi:hypothetical protein
VVIRKNIKKTKEENIRKQKIIEEGTEVTGKGGENKIKKKVVFEENRMQIRKVERAREYKRTK